MAASDEPDVAHAMAVKARLEDVTPYQCWLGEVGADDPGYPYYVLWATPGLYEMTRLSGYGGEITSRFQVTVAGLNPYDVTGAAARALKALSGWRPVIAGRRCGQVAQDQQIVPGTPTPTPPPISDPKSRALGGQSVFYTPLFIIVQSSAMVN